MSLPKLTGTQSVVVLALGGAWLFVEGGLRIAHYELPAVRGAFVVGAACGYLGALADRIAKNLGRKRVAEGGVLRWGLFGMWLLPFLSSILAFALVPSQVAASFGVGALGMFAFGLSLTVATATKAPAPAADVALGTLTWPEFSARHATLAGTLSTVRRTVIGTRVLAILACGVALAMSYLPNRPSAGVVLAAVLASAVVSILLVAVIAERRIATAVGAAGLTCPNCGARLVDRRNRIHLRHGACEQCGAPILREDPLAHGSRDPAHPTAQEFRTRLVAMERTQRLSALFITSAVVLVVGFIWVLSRQGPSHHATAVASTALLVALAIAVGAWAHWMDTRVSALGLRCSRCNVPFVGERGNTNEILQTGTCGVCSARAFDSGTM